MATLLLTAVGSALAGPIGGAIGALAGQRVDQALFAPKGRRGARLADLSVQSSNYGASIPRIYGRMRVSGTVIWATDLREERRRVSQGKGRPKATVYSYSASFAVLLSARPASRISRIWADGKLLRGAAGDFKIETGFRFYSGTMDQSVDPLIGAAEGPAAPAYRGRAYAVFEDMALESFGNRIPMISFEVIADEAGVTTEQVLTDLANGSAAATSSGVLLDGYIADGATVRGAIAPLEMLLPIALRDDGNTAELGASFSPPTTVHHEVAGASTGAAVPRLETNRVSSATLPARAELGFAEIARDYQRGLQSVDLHQQGDVLQIELPAALGAEAARRLITDCLFRARQEGLQADLRLPWRCLPLWQATSILFDGVVWRIRSLRFEAMCLVLTLVQAGSVPSSLLPADAGRPTLEEDRPAGETVLHLADLPAMGDVAPVAPQLVAAAAGRSAGWRAAALLVRSDGQGDWQEIGVTAAPATIGTCLDALAQGSPHLFDLANTLTVELLHDGMQLFHADDGALDAGANAALVGSEIIQFGRAESIGANRWKLSHLLRGRRGTEADVATHIEGEPFFLLDPDTLLPLPVPLGTGSVEVIAKGVGDAAGVQARCDDVGRAVRPLSPVHLRWDALADGGIRLHWVRRSREG